MKWILLLVYGTRLGFADLDSARQSQIEASATERERPFPVGKADEEDRFGKVVASPNSQNLNGCRITAVCGLEALYPNNLKNREFDKEGPQNFCSEQATIVDRQGARMSENYEATLTQSKPDSSSRLGITLKEAEEIALANNPQVQASEQLIEMARQGRLDAISKWLPQLNIYTQGFKTQTTIPLLQVTKPSTFLTELTLTQTVFSSQTLYQIGISSLMIEQFERLLEAAKNDVLYQTRTLYFQVALDHKKVKTAEEHIDLLSYLSDRMQGKYNIGEATAYNVNQARVAVANVTDAYYRTVQMLKSHEDELSRTLGYDPVESPFTFNQEDIDVLQVPELAEKVKVAESLFQDECIVKNQFVLMQSKIMDKIFSGSEFSKWSTYADAYRPDIRLSETNVKLAEETVKLKRGEYWPTVSLIGNYGGAMTPYLYRPSTQFDNQIFQWAVGFSVNWTIFDGTGRERRIRKAQAESRAVRYTAKKVTQAAHTNVREQLYSMQKALSQYVTSTANYKLAKETLEQAKSQLDIGFTTIYDYLISVDGLIRAKTAQDEGRFDLLSSYHALLHASGRANEGALLHASGQTNEGEK